MSTDSYARQWNLWYINHDYSGTSLIRTPSIVDTWFSPNSNGYIASVPGFSFMQYGCGAENTAKKKKSLVDFDHVGTVTCNGMQFCHTSYLGVK